MYEKWCNTWFFYYSKDCINYRLMRDHPTGMLIYLGIIAVVAITLHFGRKTR